MPACKSLLLAGSLVALPAVHATSTASIHNACSFDVYVAVVEGVPTGTSPPSAKWTTLSAGGSLTDAFSSHPVGQGVSLKVAADNSNLDSNLALTQMEYTWNPNQTPPKTWFDVSNVNTPGGAPFLNEGFTMSIDEGCTDVLNTCTGASCEPGDAVCQATYNFDTDDTKGRACSDQVDLSLTLCQYQYESTTCPNS